MIEFLKFIIISCLVLFGSCLSTAGIFNPCRNNNFLSNLDQIDKKELLQIEQDLKNKKYTNNNYEGCRSALLARLSLIHNNPREASRYFARAAEKMPELRDYFILAQAFAELKNNSHAQAKNLAMALLDTHRAPGSAHFRTRIMQVLAEVALKQKDHQQVIKTHQELLDRGYGDKEALLFNVGTSLSIMGEHKKADEIFKQLLIRFPTSNYALETEKVKNLAHRYFDIQQIETRFNKLIENLAFDRAVSEIKQEIKKRSPKNLKDREDISALHGFAIKALMLSNQFDKGISWAKARAQHKDALSQDLESCGWGYSKIDRPMQASHYYTRMAESSNDKVVKARGCFFAGFSLYEARYYTLAQLRWQQCESVLENSSFHENYLWYQALSALLTQDVVKAQRFLHKLLDKFKKSPDRDKYTYFLGYTLNYFYKKNAGNAFLQKLANSNDPSYYVLLARQALGLKAPSTKAVSADALVQKTLCKNATCEKALTLYNLGFKDEARDLILTTDMPAQDRLSLLQSMGLYHDAWQRSHILKPQARIKNNMLVAPPAIRSSYPRAHKPIIDEMSRKYDIDKSLLYAIIRAESGFLHDAKSYRGALGLMQMMPFVAHDLADKLALEKFDPELLKEPKVAIELGALLLATLKRQFGATHLVIAAYNAGPHQVQKWLDNCGDLPIELFIERIPFQQTRDYVKKVLSSQSLYTALEGQPLVLAF
jgi:soluble lytic murein transglycosylase